MVKQATYVTEFPCSSTEYFDLMLDVTLQKEIHLDGLGMETWEAQDFPLIGIRNGISRTVFSEPSLKVPQMLKKFIQKAQSYHEYSDFYPPMSRDDLSETMSERRCTVVPLVGGKRMTFTFTEFYSEHPESTKERPSCLVRSEVFVEVRAGLGIGNLIENWIVETSREKVSERDSYVRNLLEKTQKSRNMSRNVTDSKTGSVWRRTFYTSRWFAYDDEEEDTNSENSTTMNVANNFVSLKTLANEQPKQQIQKVAPIELEKGNRKSSSSTNSEEGIHSLESFPSPINWGRSSSRLFSH
jgi:hypothetical protein